MISAKAAKSTAGASLHVGAASACARHRTPPADCPASAPPCPTPTQHAQISHNQCAKQQSSARRFQRFSRSSLTCSGCVRQVNHQEGDLKVQLYLAGFLCVKGIHNIEVKIALQPQDIIVPSMQNLAS